MPGARAPFAGALDQTERDLISGRRADEKPAQLQHIRSSCAHLEEPSFIIIGSQAVHGSISDVNDEVLVRSMEADLYPTHAPEKAELLNEIGELSRFHDNAWILCRRR